MRILLRAGCDQDLYGEFSTNAEAFVAAGTEAQLRTGSSCRDRTGAFPDPGLLVRDAGRGRRWLPRPSSPTTCARCRPTTASASSCSPRTRTLPEMHQTTATTPDLVAPGPLRWERRLGGASERKPLSYFCDDYAFAICPGERGCDLCWAAPDGGFELLEPGLTVAEAKRCAEREVAAGRVHRVEAGR